MAVDIGGTKLAAAVVDRRGSILESRRMPTPSTTDPEVLFGALTGLVDGLTTAGPWAGAFERCGVGCGGPMSSGGEEVSPLNIPAWRNFPLRRRLSEHTSLEVSVDNDAKALALGEAWVGAARGLRSFVAMVVSTGVGGGIVLDGRLLEGNSGNAGHIGHVIVEPDGRVCGCGARGCVEAEASGSAIAAITGDHPSNAPIEIRRRSGVMVGRAVASVANLLDVELTVVGGSVALGFGQPFFEAANDELRDRARLSFSSKAQIVPVGLGADAPLAGAAAVAWRDVGLGTLGQP